MYFLVLCGAALCGWRVAELMRATIHHEALTEQIVKLVKANNLSRARKLARATGPTAYGAMLRAVLADAADFAGSSSDPKVAAGALEATFDRAHREQMARLSKGSWRAWGGGIFAAAGAGLALTASPVEIAPLAVAVAALMGCIWSSITFQRIDRGSREGMARLSPVLAEHVAGQEAASPKSDTSQPVDPEARDESDRPGLFFRIHEPDKEPRTLALAQPIIKIGKLSSSHMRLDDQEASRMHAVIEVSDEGLVQIIDLGSRKGTWVDGKKVNKAELQPGSEIRIADTRIELISVR